jgi:hypothetical protein
MLRTAQGCSGSEKSCTATAQGCLFIAQVTVTCAQVSKWKWNLERSRLVCEYWGGNSSKLKWFLFHIFILNVSNTAGMPKSHWSNTLTIHSHLTLAPASDAVKCTIQYLDGCWLEAGSYTISTSYRQIPYRSCRPPPAGWPQQNRQEVSRATTV